MGVLFALRSEHLMSLEPIANFCLSFGHVSAYLPVLLAGFFLWRPKAFGFALLLLLFTMIYNVELKYLFKVPLPPALSKEGYGLPSGHMHAAFVVWGWLFLQLKNWPIRVILSSMLGLLAFALLYKGFHYPIDILAAVGFGALTLLIFSLLAKALERQKPGMMGLLLLIPSTLLIFFLIPNPYPKIWLWQAYGALIGLTLGWLLNAMDATQTDWLTKFASFFMGFSGMVGLFYTFALLPFEKTYFFIGLQFAAMGFWIPLTPKLIRSCKKILLNGKQTKKITKY